MQLAIGLQLATIETEVATDRHGTAGYQGVGVSPVAGGAMTVRHSEQEHRRQTISNIEAMAAMQMRNPKSMARGPLDVHLSIHSPIFTPDCLVPAERMVLIWGISADAHPRSCCSCPEVENGQNFNPFKASTVLELSSLHLLQNPQPAFIG